VASAAPLGAFRPGGNVLSQQRLLAVLAAVVGAVAGVAAAQLTFGSATAIALLAALVVVVVVWIAPWTGVIGLVAAGTVIEQFPLANEGAFTDGTDRIVLFQSLNTGAGLGGIFATPFELFLGLLLAVWLIKGFANRSLRLPNSALGLSVGAFALLVALGWVRGVTGGGSFQDALLELRPWLYLTIAFVAASQLITKPEQVKVLLAVLAAGVGIKGIQGVITLLTHLGTRPQAILAHEESFFFGLYIAILAGLWLLPIKGRLRGFMTLLFPFVLAADIANQRRTAWAIAAAVLVTVFILCFLGFPERRRMIAMFAVLGCVMGAIYWIGFSNDPGLLGQPARALISQIAPSYRDQQSNQYRTVENVDLGIAIRQSTPFGTGFGHPIPQAVPNVDISNIDSFISYLPHNGVLYVWLRLGVPGIAVFWLLIGVALMTAIGAFRRRSDPVTLLIGLTVAAALVAYLVQGFYDMGLYWFRIAAVMGCLLGALEASRRFEQSKAQAGGLAMPQRSTSRGESRRDLRSAA
jgi:O-antigen ligase/polysaccharide polymerase Wzy-like membrane protein